MTRATKIISALIVPALALSACGETGENSQNETNSAAGENAAQSEKNPSAVIDSYKDYLKFVTSPIEGIDDLDDGENDRLFDLFNQAVSQDQSISEHFDSYSDDDKKFIDEVLKKSEIENNIDTSELSDNKIYDVLFYLALTTENLEEGNSDEFIKEVSQKLVDDDVTFEEEKAVINLSALNSGSGNEKVALEDMSDEDRMINSVTLSPSDGDTWKVVINNEEADMMSSMFGAFSSVYEQDDDGIPAPEDSDDVSDDADDVSDDRESDIDDNDDVSDEK